MHSKNKVRNQTNIASTQRHPGDTLLFATHLPAYVCRISFRRYGPLQLPLSCEIANKVFWAPDL